MNERRRSGLRRTAASTMAVTAWAALAATSAAPVGAQDGGPPAPPSIVGTIESLHARVDARQLEQTVRDLVAFGTRHVLSATDDPKSGTGAARNYLEARMRAIAEEVGVDRLSVTRHEPVVTAARLRRAKLSLCNVVATLRGTTDPNRVYVVGGHYDSRNGDGADGAGPAPGANDDGSGTAVVVELCRVLARTKFPATLVFVCYDGEEQGLLGSAAHAEMLSADDALVVDGMITNDIVGNTMGMDGVRRRDYLRCFSYAPRGNDSIGRSMARAASRAGSYVDGVGIKLVYRGDRYGRGGDHRPFAQRGIPAIRLTEPREDYSRQHQNVSQRDGKPYADLPEFMDFDYLAAVTKINAALLAELAAAPRAPKSLRVRGARQSYDTILTWRGGQLGSSKDVYEAVWRDTTAADWTGSHVFEADEITSGRGGALTAKIEGLCLDDVVVGIRAVGSDGARSRVTTPPEPDAISNRPTRRRGGR